MKSAPYSSCQGLHTHLLCLCFLGAPCFTGTEANQTFSSICMSNVQRTVYFVYFLCVNQCAVCIQYQLLATSYMCSCSCLQQGVCHDYYCGVARASRISEFSKNRGRRALAIAKKFPNLELRTAQLRITNYDTTIWKSVSQRLTQFRRLRNKKRPGSSLGA